ncbi:unnamed protein product [Oikopleura dioica]|uniref:Nuclear receptor domain-containing protein n=1 Tax=Oikopleura dioica TaxID=34765 RepID=E4YUG9_OIKDI|nr:unnamed protein product [Oikopleura dioica]
MSFLQLTPRQQEILNLPEEFNGDFSLDDIFGESVNSDYHEQISSDSSSPQSIFDPAFFPEISNNSPENTDCNGNLKILVQDRQTVQASSRVKRIRKSVSKYDGLKMICQICDGKANGMHFNVLTCEGCKSLLPYPKSITLTHKKGFFDDQFDTKRPTNADLRRIAKYMSTKNGSVVIAV